MRALGDSLSTMAVRVRQIVKQTKARIFAGLTQLPGKIVSVFEPQTEIIRKGKASKLTEFGKLVQLQEAENQIITHYEVFYERPSDRELLLGAVEAHEPKLGRLPQMVTADAGYYSLAQERAVQEKGVKWVAVPNRSTRSPERKQMERAAGSRKRNAGARAAKDASAWPSGGTE